MGRRSRKRGTSGEPPRSQPGASGAGPRAPGAPVTPRRRARLDELPPAPWSPFPLTELAILVGIILVVLGFITAGENGTAILVMGLVLITLSTLEQTLREHLAGVRSHSLLLAGVAAVGISVPLFFLTPLPQTAILVAGAVAFGTAFYGLREVFRNRAGGLGFRA